MSVVCSASLRDFLKKCFTGAMVLGASGGTGLLATVEQGMALERPAFAPG
jgi:hypothetical protein